MVCFSLALSSCDLHLEQIDRLEPKAIITQWGRISNLYLIFTPIAGFSIELLKKQGNVNET